MRSAVKCGVALRVPVKASLLFTLSGAVTKGIAVLTTLIFTRLLLPDEYGAFALYNTWLGVFTAVATLQLGGSVLYRGMQKFRDRAEGFLSGALTLCAIPILLTGAALFLFAEPIAALTGLRAEWLPFLYMQIAAETILTFAGAGARYRYRPLLPLITGMISAVATPVLAIFLIKTTALRAGARIIAGATVALGIAIPVAVAIYRRGKTALDRDGWRFIFRFHTILIPHYLAIASLSEVGRLVVGRVSGTEALAGYSIAYTVGIAPTLLTVGINSALQPWLLRKSAAGEIRRIGEVATRILLLLSLSVSVLLLLVPELFSLLAPDSYRAAMPLAVPVAIAVLPLFLYSVSVSMTFYQEKTGRASMASLGAAAVNLVLSIFLIPRFGASASAWITLISYTLLALFHYLIMRKTIGENTSFVKNTLLIFAFTVLFGVFTRPLYPFAAFRILAACFLGAVILFLLYKSKSLLTEQKA